MPGGYGSEKNGVSLGVFWDSVSLNSDGSQARIVGAEIRIHRDVNISDSTNKLSWSGGAVNDGSDSNINVSGSGNKTIKSVMGQWQDLEYGSTKSENFAASMSGVDYAGGTISESRSVTYPARAYAAPIAPTDLNWTQTSIGNFTLTWTNQATAAAPWTTVVLVRTEVGGATTEIPVSSAASSITQNGMALDKRYTWYLRITNPTSTVASAPTAMTPIPLHSMTLSASSVAIGGSVTFTINKYGSSNLSTIYFIKNGVKTIVWDKQSGTSFAYTFTQADWAAFLPNETSKVFVVGIETFAGTTSLGAQTQNLTVTVPAAAPYLPDATAPTRSEQVAVIGTAFGTNVFVKNKSRIRYTWSGSAGANATITKREILITRSWQSGQSVIDVTSASGYMYEEVPTGNGTVTVASRTTDSRGRIVTSGNATFTVYNYADPVITTFTVTRCDSAGNTNNSGTYVKFTINVAATSVNPGSEANQMQFRIRLLDSSGNETGSDLYAKALNDTLTESLTTGALGGGAYSAQAGYSFRLTLNDDLTNANAAPVTKAASISSEVYPLTIGTNGIAIGKVYNDSSKALDVVGDSLLTGGLTVTGPVVMTVPSHTHDDRYYTETEMNTLLSGKQAAGSYAAAVHTHTKSQIIDFSHTHSVADITNDNYVQITPTLTNVNLGTGGTNIMRYRKLGSTIRVQGVIVLGTGASVTGDITITLPSAANMFSGAPMPFGTAIGMDASGSGNTYRRLAFVHVQSGTTTVKFMMTSDANYFNASGPWTWAAGDSVRYSFEYEAS